MCRCRGFLTFATTWPSRHPNNNPTVGCFHQTAQLQTSCTKRFCGSFANGNSCSCECEELELSENCKCIITTTEQSVTIKDPNDYSVVPEATFTFDHAYFMSTKQEAIYADLGVPILQAALNGYNGTIFAYGQTGAGKTHSITGTPDDPGIVPRMNQDLFSHISRTDRSKVEFLVSVSFLELYNENVHDLMNNDNRTLKVREHPKLGVYVEDLVELVVHDHLEIEKKMIQGNSMRHVAATKMNERSSRSHSVFTIKVEQKDISDSANKEASSLLAKINLVDLAGSERVGKTEAEGNTLKEAAMINTSLSALGNVINALADPKKRKGHIPFRSSKLTRLLQESLGGNTITIMIAAISPADRNFDETLNTLQYANRAKSIQNSSRKNVTNPTQIVKELRQQLEELQAKLMGSAIEAPHAPVSTEISEELRSLEDEKALLSQKFDEDRWVGLAKNGVLQFKIHYYRKEKTKHDAVLETLNKDIAALCAASAAHETSAEEIMHEINAYNARKAELEKAEKAVRQRLRDVNMSTILEKWRTSLAQTKILSSTLKNQQQEIEFLQGEAVRAQSLESKLDLQAKTLQLLHTEATTLKNHNMALENKLTEKSTEMDNLCAEVEDMLTAENNKIAELQGALSKQTDALSLLQKEQESFGVQIASKHSKVVALEQQLHEMLAARQAIIA